VGSKPSDGAAVTVREGFWADQCAIEATLTTGSQGGIAFRVQDKGNYFLGFGGHHTYLFGAVESVR
jgi:hypothetical protein